MYTSLVRKKFHLWTEVYLYKLKNQPAAWKSLKSSSVVSSELWFSLKLKSGWTCSLLGSSFSSSNILLGLELGDLGVLGEEVGERVGGGGLWWTQ